MSSPIRFTVSLRSRLLLLALMWFIGLLLTGVITFVLTRNGMSTPKVRIATVMQDILMFILPTLVTAMLVTRRPAELLAIHSRPRLTRLLLSIGLLIAFTPAMNAIIEWNASLTLPQSMAAIEEWMRTSEASAEAMIAVLTGPHTIPSLIMSILIVGIFAGFSEELLFRGGIQRLLTTGKVNTHVAVWTTAIIFSAIHMQFFGFFPRMLLGALFGYLLVWTGSLWIPVIIHALNNTIVVITMWIEQNPDSAAVTGIDINSFGTNPLMIAISLAVSAVIITIFYRMKTLPGSSVAE